MFLTTAASATTTDRLAVVFSFEELGIVRGEVRRFDGPLPVPQIGWNRVAARGPLFDGVEREAFYFVNSYAARDAAHEIASADYNGSFTAAVQHERVFGVLSVDASPERKRLERSQGSQVPQSAARGWALCLHPRPRPRMRVGIPRLS